MIALVRRVSRLSAKTSPSATHAPCARTPRPLQARPAGGAARRACRIPFGDWSTIPSPADSARASRCAATTGWIRGDSGSHRADRPPARRGRRDRRGTPPARWMTRARLAGPRPRGPMFPARSRIASAPRRRHPRTARVGRAGRGSSRGRRASPGCAGHAARDHRRCSTPADAAARPPGGDQPGSGPADGDGSESVLPLHVVERAVDAPAEAFEIVARPEVRKAQQHA